ncbi:MAG: aspartate carbamoyltransferase catalytic subunit [Bdellovibrionales bacterium]|nr:aspartate carbamoyltransferase catalytic subunit [Bdellovibrionales bacterium]
MNAEPQLELNTHHENAHGKHLLGIQGLTREELCGMVADAATFVEVSDRSIKKVPALRGKTILNVFLEPSTRTRVSFEIAGKRLSADTINLTASGSSAQKGENLMDTARTLQAMAPDVVVIRHWASGAAKFLAEKLRYTSIVNAGDGMNEHPTQALLDLLTIQRHFGKSINELSGLSVAIVGDVRHSRVARSAVWSHLLLGNKVRLVGPPTLVPEYLVHEECFGSRVMICSDLQEGIEGADVVMALRMQKERQNQAFIGSLDEYSKMFGLSRQKLDRFCPGAVVLHPGPANRGIEINGELMYEQRSLIEEQVRYGVAVRMSVLFRLGSRDHRLGDDWERRNASDGAADEQNTSSVAGGAK